MKKFAVVFPGQGSQQVGMLLEVAKQFPQVKALFCQASDRLGYDLWQLVVKGPKEKLDQTIYAQPALLVADVAMWHLFRLQPKLPIIMAGHSLGEYAALVAAGALTFHDALELVSQRARFMQEAVPLNQGAMAAIVALPIDEVRAICQKAAQQEVVAVANINEARQIVIAGNVDAIDRAMILAKKAGARLVKKLDVSVPSHCQLMKPAASKLAESLAKVTIKAPKISVVNNVDVKIYSDGNNICQALLRQVYSPVRWMEIIELMAKNVDTIIECGPGQVLTGQNRRIVSHIKTMACNSIDSLSVIGV